MDFAGAQKPRRKSTDAIAFREPRMTLLTIK